MEDVFKDLITATQNLNANPGSHQCKSIMLPSDVTGSMKHGGSSQRCMACHIQLLPLLAGSCSREVPGAVQQETREQSSGRQQSR